MWTVVVASVVAHCALFFTLRHWLSPRLFGSLYAKLSAHEKLRWNERSVALLHAVFSAQGSVRALVSILPTPLTVEALAAMNCALATPGQELAEFYLSVTLGYFLYDTLLYGTVARHHGLVDWAHHIISEAQYAANLGLRFAYLTPTALQTNELSTPWLHLSWFLGKAADHGAIGGRVAKFLLNATQLIFAVLFLVCRVAFDTFVAVLAFRVVVGRSCPAEVPLPVQIFSLACFVLYLAVQYFWGVAIVCKFANAISGKRKSWPSAKAKAS